MTKKQNKWKNVGKKVDSKCTLTLQAQSVDNARREYSNADVKICLCPGPNGTFGVMLGVNSTLTDLAESEQRLLVESTMELMQMALYAASGNDPVPEVAADLGVILLRLKRGENVPVGYVTVLNRETVPCFNLSLGGRPFNN